jgi:glycosyltransferase involved in cell wall biosynthesis
MNGTAGALKVLYVSPHAGLGGAERTMIDLIELHDRRAVEPAVCFLRDGPLVAHCRDVLKVPTSVIVAPRLRNLVRAARVVRELAELVRGGGFRLVHSVMAWGHLYGGRAARRARVPCVWYQQMVPERRSLLEVAAAFRRANAIIANSEFTASAQRHLNPWRVPIPVVHLGTRIPAEPRQARRARGRAKLSIGPNEFTVGIAARLQPWKGQDVVIRAAASLLNARRHARLLVIGDALFGFDLDYKERLRVLARELGIEDRVAFTGFRDDVPDCLAALDVAIHASVRPEPFGLALVEAMAAGTALVAADSGASREIVTPGYDGLLVTPGDHEALATALLTLCDDPARRAELGAAGAQTAAERFNASLMTRNIERIYRDLVPR